MELIGSVAFSILALLVTLGILVTIHEFGHFWVARRCGVRVECFSIGFGRAIHSWRRGDTEYRIAAIPLGGYVKMFGEQGQEITEAEKAVAFSHKPLSQRAAIVAAGPLANFLLAGFLYWLMFMAGVSGVVPVVGNVTENTPAAFAGLQVGDEIIAVDGEETRSWQEVHGRLLQRLGESGNIDVSVRTPDSDTVRHVQLPIERWLAGQGDPDILGSLGISPRRQDIPARIGQLVPDGRAEQGGLQPGDLILEVNGIAVQGWFHWVELVRQHPETDMLVSIRRDERTELLSLRPASGTDEADGSTIGFIGAGVSAPEVQTREIRYSPLAAMPQAVAETWNNIVFILGTIKKMIVGLISVENLSGPITIAQVAGETASYGPEYFISFLAILSISLGVLNLLPIPMLDGGHLFYYAIEAIIRRPLPEKIQAMGMQLGILLIASIMFVAFYNDINRLL